MRDKLIKAGVKNLREFGYPEVNEANILTDAVYSAFFAVMLQDNLGYGMDAEINELLEEIKSQNETTT